MGNTYLNSRKQSVTINGSMSHADDLDCNVPQGSVFGPQMYSDFTAPVEDVIGPEIEDHFYADDSLVYKMAPVPDGDEECSHGKDTDVGDMETPQFNIAVDSDNTSSDEEDLGPEGQGYQLLPQEPDGAGDSSGSNVIECQTSETTQSGDTGSVSLDNAVKATLDCDINQCSGVSQNLPDLPNSEAEERREIWSKQKACAQSVAMDTEQVQTIKSAMANIKFPTPDWAKVIPEEEWKKQLFSRLHQQEQPKETKSIKESSNKKDNAKSDTCDKLQEPSTSKVNSGTTDVNNDSSKGDTDEP